MDTKRIIHGSIRGGLMALALVGCGRTGAEEPRSQALADQALANRCEATPPPGAPFQPELEWAWTGGGVFPNHTNVIMTPVVVDTNGDGVPDVVFNSYEGENFTSKGILRAIDGATGRELWAVTDPAHRVRGVSNIAAGDIDGDGRVEICTVHESGQALLCFEHDGTFKFRTSQPGNNWGGPSLADLDGDGQVEILNGHAVFSATGMLKWLGVDGAGGPTTGPISFATDIDGDGVLEVVNGRSIYRADGRLKCSNPFVGHGLAGVGDFDGDPAGEVVVVWSGFVSLMDDDCALLWTVPIPGGGVGGAPTIADMDGDGSPEVGVSGTDRYTVFTAQGQVKWTSPTRDHSSSRTSSAAFDFDGDGKAEVVYADEQRLRIHDGTTGAVRMEVPHSSCTSYENPVVADVDGDGNAELLVAQNTTCGLGDHAGLRLYRERRDRWVNTRGLWNQHAYSVVHINDDGTLPVRPVSPWLRGFNAFRANSQGAPGLSPLAAPDVMMVEGVKSSCDPTTLGLTLSAWVRNVGDAATSAGLPVAFYQGDPDAGGTLLGTGTVATRLLPGAEARVETRLARVPGLRAKVWAVADDTGTGTGREHECEERNNTTVNEVSLQCAPSASALWTLTASMRRPRLQHTATRLADGRVLVTGGFDASSELYDPVARTWAPTGATLTPHRGHTATRLADGTVLLVGGGQEAFTLVHAELYTPASGTWKATASPRALRYHHTATRLADGRVLVTGGLSGEYGGAPLAAAELYDPATQTWSPAGEAGTPRGHHTASPLADGTVLLVGGVDAAGRALASAELYDPATGRFTPVPGPRLGRAHHTATVLPDGRVLVVGGTELGASGPSLTELYDPASRAWAPAGASRTARRDHVAHVLPTGRVLVTGGYHESAGILTASELYEPARGLWSDTAPLHVDRYQPAAVPLEDGTVLVVGGVSNASPASAEFYTP
ncbi:kelch repeat-containing protein [Archangium primigenium]|uniref:kelch repeat-containing protein n=1 Tax=[Archangium] primigenium TaxID=2792470 RepID=UPI0019598AC0|nr:kelch repeat-containing protein [Archangium primigenium]MBM7112434.1 VCBS repeat-containing protein [Archangium primigenium]